MLDSPDQLCISDCVTQNGSKSCIDASDVIKRSTSDSIERGLGSPEASECPIDAQGFQDVLFEFVRDPEDIATIGQARCELGLESG